MSSKVSWILFIGLIILVFIGLAIYLQTSRPTFTPPNRNISINYFGPLYQWTEAVPVVDSSGTPAGCKGYQFPIIQTSSTQLSMGVPTLNSQKLENPEQHDITVTDPFDCLDSDRLNAMQVEHTCGIVSYECSDTSDITTCKTFVKTDGPPPVKGQGCQALNGSMVPFGGKEQFFAVCDTSDQFGNKVKPLYCPGQVSGISVGFQATSFTDLPCIIYNELTNEIGITTGNGCNLADPNQQFRVIQTFPGNTPFSTVNPGSSGNQGFLVSIVDRETGQCVIPSVDKSKIVLGACAPFNGYIWALIPPLVFDEDLGPSAQQITYVGDGNPSDYYRISLNNPADLLDYLQSINAVSMSNVNQVLTLKPFTTEGFPSNYNNIIVDGRDRNSQIASFLLYNVIMSGIFTPF